MSEIELILTKLKIISEEKENGAYICDKKHSKILLNYIKQKDKEIERLNNIINELEKYINENYIYDEVGMKVFDASTLQDKLQELKGSDKE